MSVYRDPQRVKEARHRVIVVVAMNCIDIKADGISDFHGHSSRDVQYEVGRLLLKKGDVEMPVGLGGPETTAVAPAIGNAIFAVTRARVRDLPIRPRAVLAVLEHGN